MNLEQQREVDALRRLVSDYMELATDPVQDERREHWRALHALEDVPPCVIVNGGNAFRRELFPPERLACSDPLFQGLELNLSRQRFIGRTGADIILEPWLNLRAVFAFAPERVWGEIGQRRRLADAWIRDPVIHGIEDVENMVVPTHAIDEEATARNAERLQEAVGDLIEINIDRSPSLIGFGADLAYWLGQLRGIEQILWDTIENPDLLRRMCDKLLAGILKQHQEAEDAGDWNLGVQNVQAPAYARELPAPQPAAAPSQRRDMWCFIAAQEFDQVSPQAHKEFLLDYQVEVARRFGLTAYGCCEDLTLKIDLLRAIPNLRRIAVSPWADIRVCAEKIGKDYVMSWRPNPACVARGVNTEAVEREVASAVEVFRGLNFEVNLKDITTVGGEAENLTRWVTTVKKAIEKRW